MTTVLDASALVMLLTGQVGAADVEQFDDAMVAPDLMLGEVGNGLRRATLRGVVGRDLAPTLLQQLLEMPIELEPSGALIERAFEMLDNLSVPDACYVALAEQRSCRILTSDARLARAPGLTVPFTVI